MVGRQVVDINTYVHLKYLFMFVRISIYPVFDSAILFSAQQIKIFSSDCCLKDVRDSNDGFFKMRKTWLDTELQSGEDLS